MPTVEQIAHAALRDVGDAPGVLNASAWAQERYEELATVRLKHLLRHSAVVVPAVVTAGTVTVTSGSDIVTGDATAQAAWNADLVGRFLQVGNVWYRIKTVTATPTLQLETVYTETTAAGASYKVVARYVLLPDDVQYLARTFTHTRLRRPIVVGTLQELERMVPDRLYNTGGPHYVADVGVDPVSSRRMLEVYAYSTQAEALSFRYWAKPRKFQANDELPDFIDEATLKEGVLVNCMRWLMAEALRKQDKEGAAHWRNEYRAQETRWLKVFKPQLIKRDQALEDFAIEMRDGRTGYRDVRSARDEVFVRGNRP